MFKKLIAGVLLASVAVSAIAPVASANAEGKGQVKSNKDFVSRTVGFSGNNNDRLDTLIAGVTCDYFDGAVANLLATTPGITVFLPTNYAFRKLGRTLDDLLDLGLGNDGITAENICLVDDLLGDGTLLTILQFHVYGEGKVWFKQAKAARGASLEMLSGELAEIGGTGNHVTWDGGDVVVKNIRSANGLGHVVNEVGVPPSIEAVLAAAAS